jgi:hypothetical protein
MIAFSYNDFRSVKILQDIPSIYTIIFGVKRGGIVKELIFEFQNSLVSQRESGL